MQNYKLKLFKGAMQLLFWIACIAVAGVGFVEVL